MKRLIDFSSRFRILKGGKISMVVSALLASTTISYASPSGGVVTSGTANISQSGNTTNINQSTHKATINWNKFNISKNETVNFNQPNASSITLNRVIGNERSVINGALNANGQVWILNSNGVLFGKNASINTAGLLATTAKLSDNDFNIGNYNFKNTSTNSVINLGTINISNEAYAILAGKEVTNEGSIKAVKGKIHLVGADEYSINLNGNSLLNLTVKKGILDSIVKNSGSIKADAGEIYLTTNAVNELLKGVVNNTGVIEANSMGELTGKVELFAHGGEAQVGGSISATDGFVETSGKDFTFDGANIITSNWLIDPVDITIDAALATAIQNALDTADVTITTDGSNTPDTSNTGTNSESAGEGDITVNSDITWSSAKTLTLSAANNINVNNNIKSSSTDNGAGVIFLFGQKSANGDTNTYSIKDGVAVNAKSVQWRKGSDKTSLRYAIVDGAVFLGNNYIELGINKNGGFGTVDSTGTKAIPTPSLFFGRQAGNGIGMVGDADGFNSGKDLRIDYFLPGTPYEGFSVSYDGKSEQKWNYTANGTTTIELLGIDSDGLIQAKTTSKLGDLEIEQTISLDLDSRKFNNKVSLSNTGTSDISNVVFTRSVDPDNTQDMGGDYATINKIEKLISAGDSVTAVSATSIKGDAYEKSAGNQTKIIYSTSNSAVKVGYGKAFFDGTIAGMTSSSNALSNGDTKTADEGIGLIYSIPTLVKGTTSSFNYLTYLTNQNIFGTPTATETPTNNNEIQKVITTISNKNLIKFDTPKAFNLNLASPNSNVALNTNIKPTTQVSLSELKKDNSGDIRVPLSSNSIIDLVNGGVKLPEGVEQLFYVENEAK